MVLMSLSDIQPQCLINGAGVVTDNKRGVAADFQSFAELTDITASIAGGEGLGPDPVPGHVMDNVGELVYIDQDLSRDLSARRPCMAGNNIF